MKKDKLFTMKLSSAELEKYKALAKENGTTLANLINSKLQNLPPQKKDKELIFSLAKIGNNLNQIARAVNGNQKIEILDALLKIEKALEEIKNAH